MLLFSHVLLCDNVHTNRNFVPLIAVRAAAFEGREVERQGRPHPDADRAPRVARPAGRSPVAAVRTKRFTPSIIRLDSRLR